MKFNQILKKAVSAFADVTLSERESDPKLAKMDRGILIVGLLVSALDGTILPEEYAAFEALAKKARGGSEENVRALFDAVLPEVGRLMIMAQVGIYSEEERLLAFLSAAKKVLPRDFAYGSMADLRRAFALWVTIGFSDGEFSPVEKSAVHALIRRLAIARSMKTKKSATKEFLQLEADLIARLEQTGSGASAAGA